MKPQHPLRVARKLALVIAGLLLSALVQADASKGQHSEWLQLVAGERCEETGAEILSVDRNPDTGLRFVKVKVPKSAVSPTDTMEEVRVVGQAIKPVELPNVLPEFETEWIDDHDAGHYGLLVKFTAKQKVPIRLEFYTAGASWEGATTP